MKRSLNYARYLLLVVTLTACAGLGLAPADTFELKLAYAYGQHTGIQNGTAAGINQHKLTAADGKAVLKLADDARVFLDAAKATGDPTLAASKLALAVAVLTQVQAYIDSRGVTK